MLEARLIELRNARSSDQVQRAEPGWPGRLAVAYRETEARQFSPLNR